MWLRLQGWLLRNALVLLGWLATAGAVAATPPSEVVPDRSSAPASAQENRDVRTRGQLSAIGPIASTGLAMIGGCYWPIEVTPPFMQTLAKFGSPRPLT